MMKSIWMGVAATLLGPGLVGCNKKKGVDNVPSDQTIEREEEIERSDLEDPGANDFHSEDELEFERSVLGVEELDLNE